MFKIEREIDTQTGAPGDTVFDTNLLYQEEGMPKSDLQQLLDEVATIEQFSKGLHDRILSALKQRSLLDSFITTSTSVLDVEAYVYSLYQIGNEINEVLKLMEQSLADAGVSIFSEPGDEEFYRHFIKSKVGKHKP